MWYMPPVFSSQRQEDFDFEANLGRGKKKSKWLRSLNLASTNMEQVVDIFRLHKFSSLTFPLPTGL
jgi:hypothetical protein